jgi:hypothetical protein
VGGLRVKEFQMKEKKRRNEEKIRIKKRGKSWEAP